MCGHVWSVCRKASIDIIGKFLVEMQLNWWCAMLWNVRLGNNENKFSTIKLRFELSSVQRYMCMPSILIFISFFQSKCAHRSPVTHRMAPWVDKVFMQILPKILCIERPKKNDPPQDDDGAGPSEVLTDVYHCNTEMDKFTGNGEYGIPGKHFLNRKNIFFFENVKCYFYLYPVFLVVIIAMPPSRFDVAASGGVGPCFGEPPLPALPLPGGDDELFSPTSNGDLSPSSIVGGVGHERYSPTFDKPIMREVEKTIEGTRFVAQHMRNKDKFESVSIYVGFFLCFVLNWENAKWITNEEQHHRND